MFQDHDGDGRAAPAGLPLHRPEPHREGTDPLNGAPRPESRRCVQDVPHGTHHSDAAAIRDSGSDIFLQMNVTKTISLIRGDAIGKTLDPRWMYVYICYEFISILDILIFILHCIWLIGAEHVSDLYISEIWGRGLNMNYYKSKLTTDILKFLLIREQWACNITSQNTYFK